MPLHQRSGRRVIAPSDACAHGELGAIVPLMIRLGAHKGRDRFMGHRIFVVPPCRFRPIRHLGTLGLGDLVLVALQRCASASAAGFICDVPSRTKDPTGDAAYVVRNDSRRDAVCVRLAGAVYTERIM